MPPKARCTFYKCGEYDLKELTRKKPQERTSEEAAHFNRSHSDAPFVFLCKFTNKRISVRRDRTAQMMFRCICKATLLSQTSVKRHYESCKPAQLYGAHQHSQQTQGPDVLSHVQNKDTTLTELEEVDSSSDLSDEGSTSK